MQLQTTESPVIEIDDTEVSTGDGSTDNAHDCKKDKPAAKGRRTTNGLRKIVFTSQNIKTIKMEYPFNHPKTCNEFARYGNGKHGCSLNQKCKVFHQKLCRSYFSVGMCIKHLKGTSRIQNITTQTAVKSIKKTGPDKVNQDPLAAGINEKGRPWTSS